jgi:hypothetical protein
MWRGRGNSPRKAAREGTAQAKKARGGMKQAWPGMSQGKVSRSDWKTLRRPARETKPTKTARAEAMEARKDGAMGPVRKKNMGPPAARKKYGKRPAAKTTGRRCWVEVSRLRGAARGLA